MTRDEDPGRPVNAAAGTGTVRSGRRSADAHRAEVEALLRTVDLALDARPAERLRLDDPELSGTRARTRVLAETLHARVPLPPFDNSQMDGFAVRSADLAEASDTNPVHLHVGVATAAGDAPTNHVAGTASPVMTGAPIPSGADAVVPVEQVRPPEFTRLRRAGEGDPTGSVSFTASVAPGQFVRRAGSDLAAGDEIATAGARLTPARIGAIAAAGFDAVPVRPRVRILLCSTGDEIAPDPGGERSSGVDSKPGIGLAPGRIHDANTPMLAALLRSVGAEVTTVRTRDHAESLRATLEESAAQAELLVTTGGISAGAFEVVRDALSPLGATFTSVAMQPGGPQGLGLLHLPATKATLPALCFPGNPVSAMLSAELFLVPHLRSLAGLPADVPREERLLAHDTESPADKLQFRRGRIADDGRVVLSGPSSHLLAGLAAAEVIAEIPVGVDHAPEDSAVRTWKINDEESR